MLFLTIKYRLICESYTRSIEWHLFGTMIFQTYSVASGASSLKEAIKLLWTFKLPWGWAYTQGTFPDWTAQFAFGFYSLMLTSTIIGLIVMILFKPRTWCSFCPMGTMTQGICQLKAGKNKPQNM